MTTFVFDDGGRAAAGFRGRKMGDCICRAVAIVTRKPYREVYEDLTALGWTDRGHRGEMWRDADGLVIPNGRQLTREYIKGLGWRWTPTMQIGQGCKVHLRPDELPVGKLIVSVSHHLTAVIDGVIHDTYDPSRRGTRCVYGYWSAR